AVVLDRVGCLHRQARGLVDVVWRRRFADQKRFGRRGFDAGRTSVAQADTGVGYVAGFVETQLNADADDGIVTDFAFELFVRPTRAWLRKRHTDLGDQLVGVQRRGQNRDVELVD